MTLTQLRYLVAIADTGLNITLAAERCHATQPGVSKQIKHLEAELGFDLFVRRGRSLAAVTEPGLAVLERARVVVEQADNIRTISANARVDAQGELTVVTTHTQARFVLPPAVAAIRLAWPGVQVRIHPVGDADVLAELEHGRADVAITSSADRPPANGVAVPLFRWRRVIAVPHGHPLTTLRRPVTIDDLARHPLVSYESSTRPDSSLRRAFTAIGLSPQLAMTARDADLIKTYAASGLGVGILAEMGVRAGDRDELAILPAPSQLGECTAYAVLPRQRVLRNATTRLITTLAPQLDPLDLRRAVSGDDDPAWPLSPYWRRPGVAVGEGADRDVE